MYPLAAGEQTLGEYPPDVVLKFTGHSDYKSMKPYIDITEAAQRDAIKLMEAAFQKK